MPILLWVPAPRAAQRGSAVLGAALLALALGGLSFSLLLQGTTVGRSVGRTEDSLHALEAAETGVALAELEVAAAMDPNGHEVRVLSGTYDSGRYDVTATQDATTASHWIVTSKGTMRLGVRNIEVGLKRIPGGAFIEGLFSDKDLVFNGKNTTDAWDSRTGTYASEATHADAFGPYADSGGNVGSNSGFIELHGSSIEVRGDAIPGPGRSVAESGSPVVTGDTTPRKYERDLPPTPLADFQAALASNADGTWTASGGNLNYDASAQSLTLKAGGILTLPGGTYFFSNFSLQGNSTVKFTGPAKVYVTGSFDLSGGVLVNATGLPANLMIFANPYALPAGFAPVTTAVKVNGGSGAAFAMYGPNATLAIGGNSDIYGAAVASQISINGDCRFHYDKALDDIGFVGAARIERLYWREAAPPRR